jgi:hypothetical protein
MLYYLKIIFVILLIVPMAYLGIFFLKKLIDNTIASGEKRTRENG